MKIVKMIAISIVEREAEKRLIETRLSLAGRFEKCLEESDYVEADVLDCVIKIREKEIQDWKDVWVGRIRRL